MSSGVDAYYDKLQEDFLNSDKRSKDIHDILNSDEYKKFLILKDKFKEFEEYLELKEKFKKELDSLCYNL